MPITRPIFLLGMPGSGKTQCGYKLAAKLGIPFIDLDQYIEEKENKSIHQLFEDGGESAFRPLEQFYLHELAIIPDPVVISLGGGTPCFFDNMEVIKVNGVSIYLQLPVGMLVSRLLPKAHQRPLLKDKDEAELKVFLDDLLAKREPFYMQADMVVNGASVNMVELAEKVKEFENGATPKSPKGDFSW